VRLFLGGFDLTPTYKDVCNKFSVSYILNLVLVDEDDRRYFKQREVVLWRKSEKPKAKPGEETEIPKPHFVQ
jgi:vacuolar protein sorting-associated protein 26